MGKPKTEAADYIWTGFRLPPALLAAIKDRAARARRPLNTETIMLLEQALEDEEAPARPRRATPVGT